MAVRQIIPFISAACLAFFLLACTTTPKLQIIKSSGVSMELEKPAFYVFSVLYAPDGKRAYSGGLDNLVAVWDLEKGTRSKILKAQVGPGVSSLAFSRDGKYLLTGTKGGGDVRLWNAENGRELWSLAGHSITEAVEALTFSPDDGYAISGGSYAIKQWNVKARKEIKTITHASFFDRNQSYAMAFSPDGRFAFVKGIGFISLWDVREGKRRWIYGAKTGGQRWSGGNMIFNASAQFSPDGAYVLSGEGEVLRLRDAHTGRLIRIYSDEGSGHIDAVAFSPDGKYALAGSTDGMVRLWDVRTGVKVKSFIGHSGEITSVAFSPDGKRFLSGGDASTRLWDLATGKEIVAMMEFDDKEWLIITPEGYYNASENGAQYLSVTAGLQKYGVDNFYDVFYRPDIVTARLQGEDIRGLVTITMRDAIQSPPPLVEFTRMSGSADHPRINVCYRITSAGGGIGEVRLFNNGKLIQSDGYYREVARTQASGKTALASLDRRNIYEDMRSISVKGRMDMMTTSGRPKGDVFEACRDVDVISGENELSLSAFNRHNTVQSSMKTLSFRSKIKPEEARLYILAVGINRYRDDTVNLKYAVKDAGNIIERWKRQAATLYKSQNIHVALLADEEATKVKVMEKLHALAGTIKPQDSFVLFAASHGVLLQNQYYLLTHDYNGTVHDENTISSNEIVEASKKIKSLSQLFIFDTCHAGGVDTLISGLYDARMSVLAKKMGLHIYASASDKQSAMDGYKGNGLFTYTLLDGLNNKRAAGNKDGHVTIVGLGEYSRQMTSDISKEIGHSQTPLIINFGKDSAVYKLQ